MKNIKHKVILVSEATTGKNYLSVEQNAVLRLIMKRKANGSSWAMRWYEKWDTPVWLQLGKDYPLYEPKPGEVEKVMRRHLKYAASMKASPLAKTTYKQIVSPGTPK